MVIPGDGKFWSESQFDMNRLGTSLNKSMNYGNDIFEIKLLLIIEKMLV